MTSKAVHNLAFFYYTEITGVNGNEDKSLVNYLKEEETKE